MTAEVGVVGVLVEETFRAELTLELLHSEMSLDVESVLRTGGEGSRTEVALERFVSSVDPDVLLQVSLLVESFRAERTFERSVSLVPSPVGSQAGSVLELLSTFLTEEFRLGVDVEVGVKITAGLERLITFITAVGSLAVVSFEVSAEQALGFE